MSLRKDIPVTGYNASMPLGLATINANAADFPWHMFSEAAESSSSC